MQNNKPELIRNTKTELIRHHGARLQKQLRMDKLPTMKTPIHPFFLTYDQSDEEHFGYLIGKLEILSLFDRPSNPTTPHVHANNNITF